ncbi:aminotransferase class I/II-fold pyridoxal phosphate-dependent enzyme [Pelagibaca abyssi]|nr:aminotransferase class I/II-fold pyridoxal phosphate-dependent enzyme [Salipiger abyssi]
MGYGRADSAELATAMHKVRSNFSLGRLSLAAGLAALTDLPYSRAMAAEPLSESARMRAALTEAGYEPLETAANFIALLGPEDGLDRIEALKDQGILIIGFRMSDRPALRITIGDRTANDRVLAALRDLRPGTNRV